MSRLQLLQKTETQINDLIGQNKGYEALRLSVTISNRYHSMKSTADALRVAYDSTIAILKNKEGISNPSIGIEAAQNYITLLDKIKTLDEATGVNIKTIFGLFFTPTAIEPTPQSTTTTPTTTKTKYNITMHLKFMQDSIAFVRKMISEDSSNESYHKIESNLHYALAMFCFKYKSYDLGNQHFIYAKMPVQHVLILAPILTTFPLQEQGIAVVRLVLMYLCLVPSTSNADVKSPVVPNAEKFISTLLLKLPSKTSQPLATYCHCAQNMITVAKLGDVEVFRTVCSVYTQILDESPDLRISQFCDRIGELYCGLTRPKGFLDLF